MTLQPWYAPEVEAAYDSYRAELLRYVCRRSAADGVPESRLDAEGVVQEAFTAALRYWPQIRNPRAWLYAVTDRLISRAAQESGRIAPASPEEVSTTRYRWTSVAPSASPEATTEAKAVLRSLGDAPGERGVITYLYRVQGWSHTEIGEHLHMTPGAVRVSLHRQTQTLRSHWLPARPSAPLSRRRYRAALATSIVATWAVAAIVAHALGLPLLFAILGPAMLAVIAAAISWRPRR